ncbi:hypothetical protein PV04_09674 [Phialophora macrospora]|uniref:Uncharacterized protein n=1 Tax=Phialophora macrospora TaxID=1851006 RepID=A0A0D2FXX2_9EURO|nr:hypothetical protein PV04_09674 [Phialophora macrospora]
MDLAYPKQFLFINTDPASKNDLQGDALRSSARAHAARVSHAAKLSLRAKKPRGVTTSPTTAFTYRISRPAGLVDVDEEYEWFDESEECEQDDQRRQSHPAISPNHRNVFQGPLPRRKERVRGRHPGNLGRDRSPSSATEVLHGGKASKLILTIHRGNSDPFNSTIVPLKPQQFVLLDMGRLACQSFVWGSEVSTHHHNPEHVSDLVKSFGTIYDSPALTFSNLALGYLTLGAYQGELVADNLTLVKSFKGLALKSLRELVAKSNSTLLPRHELLAIKDASQMLATVEYFLKDYATARIHVVAAQRIVRMLGGLKTLSGHQLELIARVIVGQASLNSARPAVDPDEWDPGPWSMSRSAFPPLEHNCTDLGAVLPALCAACGLLSTKDVDGSGEYRPSTACAMLRSLLEDTRELAMIEDVKVTQSPLNLPSTTERDHLHRLCRWSNLRTSALRGRCLQHWCDISESLLVSASSPPPESAPTAEKRYGTFDLSMCLALRLLDKCIFQEPYLAAKFRESQVFYDKLYENVLKIDPPFGQLGEAVDMRRFDMLWIYSVGAYTEQAYLKHNDGRGGFREIDYFGTRIGPLAAQLGFKDFDDLAGFLQQQYLYCPRLQDVYLQQLVRLE